MQCYESEALRLQLYADTRRLLPETAFDPLALDEVLDEAHVDAVAQYNALEPERKADLAKRVNRLAIPKPAYREASAA